MKSFWWYQDNLIAGMARPGFNNIHWFDLPFPEAVLMGWIGQYSTGSLSLASFENHLQTYVPKIAKFYHTSPEDIQMLIQEFTDEAKTRKYLESLAVRSKLFSGVEVDYSRTGNEFGIEYCTKNLSSEVDRLKQKNIKTIATLTERDHNHDHLSKSFDCYHFPIDDLTHPTFEQVLNFSKLLEDSIKRNSPLAVHCLAGIGRTSTMLISAYYLLGHSKSDLRKTIAVKNPTYKLTGLQEKFFDELNL